MTRQEAINIIKRTYSGATLEWMTDEEYEDLIQDIMETE